MKEMLSPIGLRMRTTNDAEVVSWGPNEEALGYMGLGGPQYLQMFRTSGRVKASEMREGGKNLVEEKVLEKMAQHLDMIGMALMWGQPYKDLVAVEGVDRETAVRMTCGLKHFLHVNPELRGKTPGLMVMKGLALRLWGPHFDDMTEGCMFNWRSLVGLGWLHDGGEWEEKTFDPYLWMDQISRNMTELYSAGDIWKRP
jgi:hypothetical protein